MSVLSAPGVHSHVTVTMFVLRLPGGVFVRTRRSSNSVGRRGPIDLPLGGEDEGAEVLAQPRPALFLLYRPTLPRARWGMSDRRPASPRSSSRNGVRRFSYPWRALRAPPFLAP